MASRWWPCGRRRSTAAATLYNTWTYTAVDAPNRLEYELRFADAEGRSIRPAGAGIPAGVPAAVPHVVTAYGSRTPPSRSPAQPVAASLVPAPVVVEATRSS